MEAETDDNGTARSVRVVRDGDRLAVVADGKTGHAALDAKPLSFWHRGIATAPEIIDPVDGAVFRPRCGAIPARRKATRSATMRACGGISAMTRRASSLLPAPGA